MGDGWKMSSLFLIYISFHQLFASLAKVKFQK
jgi:hypothetical protein